MTAGTESTWHAPSPRTASTPLRKDSGILRGTNACTVPAKPPLRLLVEKLFESGIQLFYSFACIHIQNEVPIEIMVFMYRSTKTPYRSSLLQVYAEEFLCQNTHEK